MAVRSEDLQERQREGQIVRFPTAAVRRRAARQRRIEVVRRRVAVAGLLGSVVIVVLLGGGSGHSAPASADGAPRAVVLREGDTLWQVAERFAPPGVDKRAYVDALVERNELTGAPAAGAKVILPN